MLRSGGGGGGGGRKAAHWYIATKARGGGGLGGGHGGGMWWCGGGGGGGGGGGSWSPSFILLEQPLERRTLLFLQMTARVCGGVPSPLIEPLVGRERKGPTTHT